MNQNAADWICGFCVVLFAIGRQGTDKNDHVLSSCYTGCGVGHRNVSHGGLLCFELHWRLGPSFITPRSFVEFYLKKEMKQKRAVCSKNSLG